jgi:hypothetical protein
MLAAAFRTKTRKSWKLIYCAYVHPHLEFAVQAWCLYPRKDIDAIERVQRHATKMIPEIRHLSYQDRLGALNLTTLEDRCNRGDLIQQYKIHSGLESVIFQKKSEVPILLDTGRASPNNCVSNSVQK